MKDVFLSAKTIYEKDFKIDLKGYATDEVDNYLDFIIEDYQFFEKKLTILEERLKQVENENSHLRNKILEYETKEEMTAFINGHEEQNTTNYDLIKRISRLESIVLDQRK